MRQFVDDDIDEEDDEGTLISKICDRLLRLAHKRHEKR
jgi:hypothetical protein